jgi:type I restriction enzyme R subunit
MSRGMMMPSILFHHLIGGDEGKIFNLVRGLQKEIQENPDIGPVLLTLKDRAESILKDMQSRQTSCIQALDLLAALAKEKEEAIKAENESGLTPKAFAVYRTLIKDSVFKNNNEVVMDIARELDSLLSRFPNASVNSDEQRQLRSSLYRPLLALPRDDRSRIVELIMLMVLA